MKIGKLKVKLDKPYYVAGEAVTGVIYLSNIAPILMDKVYIKAKGKEKVVWEEHWTTPVYAGEGENRRKVRDEHHEKEYDEKESFFKYKIKITGQDTMLPPGKWAFPFSFQLPTHGKKGGKLTGSFKVADHGHAPGWSGGKFSARIKNLKAKVEYSLKAVVDLEGCKDLEKKVDFTVFEQLPNAVVNPSDIKTANVMFLCCINKGSCTIKGSLEKNFYCPGEVANAICEITNNSSVEIQAQAELNRLMTLRADHHTLRHRNMVKLGRFDIIMPGETKTVNMQFRIPNSHPTTGGHYIQCRYIMDIVAAISMAPDIELHFPVNIFMPQVPPEQWMAGLGDVSSYQVMPNACVVAPMMLKPGYM